MSLDELTKSVVSGNITMIHEASIKRDASKSFGIITSFRSGEFYSSINGRPFVFESVMQEIKLS